MSDADAFAPDFLIVGAPKCATSSLYAFLDRHPDVFMTTPKEPHWFCRDLPGLARVDSAAAYRALFDAAPPGARLGEASAWYLRSETAAAEIARRNPAARIVLSIRNPVDASISWFQQLRNGLREDQLGFDRSWALQDARARGEGLPPYCPEPRQLDYRALYSYHDQIARYFDAFGREQVKVILFDDIVRDPARVAAETLAFIGVAPLAALDAIPTSNARRTPRYPWLQQMLAAPPPLLRPLVRPAKRALNALGVQPSVVMMRHLSTDKPSRPAVSPETMGEMRAAFAPDVERLQRLLGLDLSAWREPQRQTS